MKKYTTLMSAYGVGVGIDFKFGGMIASTLMSLFLQSPLPLPLTTFCLSSFDLSSPPFPLFSLSLASCSAPASSIPRRKEPVCQDEPNLSQPPLPGTILTGTPPLTTMKDTLHAHRLIQHYQEEDPNPRPSSTSKSSTATPTTTANEIVSSLYTQYFEQEHHPSSPSTLLLAALAAGIDPQEAEAFVGDEYEGLPETKMLMQEQRANGVDSVPLVVVEGRKRDFTVQGAKEVDEYLAVLERVVGELK